MSAKDVHDEEEINQMIKRADDLLYSIKTTKGNLPYMKIVLPEKVKFIIETLEEHGYEAYAVGGCVRDTMLHRTPGTGISRHRRNRSRLKKYLPKKDPYH